MDTYEKELVEASDAISNREFEKALRILQPLTEREVAGAFGLLGVMYQLGEGVELNGLKAVELLSKAVELGDGTSAHNLGTIYAMGLPGVEQNREKSRRGFNRSVQHS